MSTVSAVLPMATLHGGTPDKPLLAGIIVALVLSFIAIGLWAAFYWLRNR